jgi:outer membrane protein assembly factor BamB
MKVNVLLGTCFAALAGLAVAADWPQWQGPDRNNISADTGLLQNWPEGGPKLLWSYEKAGVGYSGPAVVGDRLYTLGAEDGKEWLYALDVQTGKKLWATPVGPMFQNGYGSGPRSTPTVDGQLVYAIGGQGNLICVQADSGKRVWLARLKEDLGGVMMSGWGYSESPLVDGDKVVCTPGGKRGAVAALNKKTGEVLWRSTRYTDSAAYSSLVISEAGGVRQYVQMTGQSLAGVAAKDGRLLWRFERTSRTAAVPTPICHKDFVYASSGYGAGCTLLKISGQGNELSAEEVYSNKNMVNHHGGVVLFEDHVYGYSDGKGWVCQDFKSGELVWQERNKLEKGSLIHADGRLYCYGEKDGTLVLIEASPKGWMEHGRFRIPQPSKLPRPPNRRQNNVWTHPVVANGRLYLRDQEMLFCYDIKANGNKSQE